MFFMRRFEDGTLVLLRLIAGFLFVQHGAQKLFGVLGGTAMPLGSRFGVAGVLETVGGVLIALGLLTRPVAFILSGEMAVAYFTAHAPRGFSPLLNNGEPAVIYCFLYLYLSARGAGRYSLDARIGRRLAAAPARAPAS